MAAKPLPAAEYLRECLDYNPETGALTWKERPRGHFETHKGWRMWSCRYPGTKAGRKDKKGYVYIKLDHSGRFAHRIIWMLQTECDPGAMQIDHRNSDKSDNRWENLRLATHGENIVHRSGWAARTLPKGVYLHDGRFRAQAHFRGRTYILGQFATAEEAHIAYLAFARQEHGEFFFDPATANLKEMD